MAEALNVAKAGKMEPAWPAFRPTKPDPVLGKKEMSPEQSLIEFISTSASLHGVKKISLRNLEWDLLKVFPYNIMPANAAAWYMAKRKFYADQPADQQLLPYLLNKYPEKFHISKQQVEFLEVYSKETAKRKLNYLVQFGLDAYFTHKVEEYGVYFFDPTYYEVTEPFHESIRLCVPGVRSRLVSAFFNQQKQFHFEQHSNNLASISKPPGLKVMTNMTGVIVSMVNNQYGFLKFGSGQKALFCAKGLYRDGWQYSGDPLRLPAMYFDAYQVGKGSGPVDDKCDWFAVLVWCGKKPAPKHYCSKADFNSTPIGFPKPVTQHSEGRKLRQPSSSMMIGQVVSIRKNGAVISVREDSKDKVFVPGWSKENNKRAGVWLTTLTGDTVGLHDLVAYYIDTKETMPGFSAVGKNVMVLKEYEEFAVSKNRRNRMSVTMSSGANYNPRNSESHLSEMSDSMDDSESEVVSDSELEWLENDITELMEKDGPQSNSYHLFNTLKKTLAETRAKAQKTSPRGGRDSGVSSARTTPSGKVEPLKVGKVKNDGKMFWRTKAAFASVDEDYRSSEDEDYGSGVYESDDEIAPAEPRRVRLTSTISSVGNTSKKPAAKKSSDDLRKDELPYWIRAISYPEEYDETTGYFIPVDKWYVEEKDYDYCLPDEEEYEDDNEQPAPKVDEKGVDPIDEPAAEGDQKAEESAVEAVDNEVEEDLSDELKELLKEAEEDIPEDLLEGKHRQSAPRLPTPEKIVISKPEDDNDEKKDDEIITIEAPIKEFKIWHPYSYIQFVQHIQVDMEESTRERDDEYVPPAIILDSELDYDEFDPEEVIPDDELEGLVEDLKIPLFKVGNYIPIWIPVDSVKERKERVILEKKEAEKRKEEEAARKEMEAAKLEEAARKEVESAGSKEAAGNDVEGSAGVDMNAVAAKLVESGLTPCMSRLQLKENFAGNPKPQRKSSTGSKLTRAVLESKLEEAENVKDDDAPEEKTGDNKE